MTSTPNLGHVTVVPPDAWCSASVRKGPKWIGIIRFFFPDATATTHDT